MMIMMIIMMQNLFPTLCFYLIILQKQDVLKCLDCVLFINIPKIHNLITEVLIIQEQIKVIISNWYVRNNTH